MAENSTKPIASEADKCSREEQNFPVARAERSEDAPLREEDSLAAAEQVKRSVEDEELDGFPVFAAEEEDWDMDSRSSHKSRKSNEREENESVSPRETTAEENVQSSQAAGDSTSQSEASVASQAAGGGCREENLYSPLMKIKDEPIDEGYDNALMPSTDISRVKEELDNDDESSGPMDELRISSVFSVRGSGENISGLSELNDVPREREKACNKPSVSRTNICTKAPIVSSQPPPFPATATIKMLPVVLPGQLQHQLQAKPLTQTQTLIQPQIQLQPSFHIQPGIQLQPQIQIQTQPQPQLQPPTPSIRICCSGCSKVLQKGQTAFQRKGSNQLFCSTVCLTGFTVPPAVTIMPKKTCNLCLKVISHPKDLITVPVDASNTMKEFCSQVCLSIYRRSRVDSLKNDDKIGRCSVCRRSRETQHEVNHQGVLHRICSDECFSRFRSSKRLSMNCCENCGNCTITGNYHLVQVEDAVKKFCSPPCINTFKQKSGVRVHCPSCQDFKCVDQMLAGTNTQGVIEFFCSSRCVANSQASRTLSGASFPCTNCQKLAVPQYHLAMSDGSIRNFCSYECVAKFQEKLQRSASNTQANGGSAVIPNVASSIASYPGNLRQISSTPSQNPPLASLSTSSQNPVSPYVPFSGPDQQQQQVACLANGPVRVTCKQCQTQISSKPEILQFKNHVGLFCSRICCDIYKKEKDVKALCEYCKEEKVVKDIVIYEQQPRPFCCEGCKVLFKHDLAKQRGSQCKICAYCCNMTHSTIHNHFGGKLEEFCCEECMSFYTVLFYEMAKCYSCKNQGVLKEHLKWDGKIRYFCNQHCMLQFCCKNSIPDKPSSNGVPPGAVAVQAPLSLSKDLPVIGGVVSLASALTANTALTGALPTSNASSKIIGDASTQTDAAGHAGRRMLKNKALMCKPFVEEQAIQCELEPLKLLFDTVLDENGEKVRLVPVPVPIPVPVYIPLPMHLYTQCTPVPVGLPLPVPVPLVMPSSLNTPGHSVEKGSVPSQSSVDDEDAEKSKSRPVSHGDQGSTYSGDLESEARSTPFSWADAEDSGQGHKTVTASSVSEGPKDAPTAPTSSGVLDLEKDYPLASGDHLATKLQKSSPKRWKRAYRGVTVKLEEKWETEDSEESVEHANLNMKSRQHYEDSDITDNSSDDVQVEPLEAQISVYSCAQSRSSSVSMPQNCKNIPGILLKRQICVYCKKPNTKMARHLEKKHANETDVAHVLSFPKGSKRRRLLFQQLLKKGNYQHNIEVIRNGKGTLITTVKSKMNKSSNEYFPCQYCLGFYLKSTLLRHQVSCKKTCSQISSKASQQLDTQDSTPQFDADTCPGLGPEFTPKPNLDAGIQHNHAHVPEATSQPNFEPSFHEVLKSSSPDSSHRSTIGARSSNPSPSSSPHSGQSALKACPEQRFQPSTESFGQSREKLSPESSIVHGCVGFHQSGLELSPPPSPENLLLRKSVLNQSYSPGSKVDPSVQSSLNTCSKEMKGSCSLSRPTDCHQTSLEVCPVLSQTSSQLEPETCPSPSPSSRFSNSLLGGLESCCTDIKRSSSESCTNPKPFCPKPVLEYNLLPPQPKTLLPQTSDSDHPPSPVSTSDEILHLILESCSQTVDRPSPDSSAVRPAGCHQTNLKLSPQPTQPNSELKIPNVTSASNSQSDPPLGFTSNPSKPLPSLHSCLQDSEEGNPLSFPDSCHYTEFEFSPQPTSESCDPFSSKSKPNPRAVNITQTGCQLVRSRSASSQASLRSRPSDAKRHVGDCNESKFEMDSNMSDVYDYHPTVDLQSCSSDLDENSERPDENSQKIQKLSDCLNGSSSGQNISPADIVSDIELQNDSRPPTQCPKSSPQSKSDSSLMCSISSSSDLKVITFKKAANGAKVAKKHFCVFCKKPCIKIARHLKRVHLNEEEIAHAYSFRKGSAKRLLLLEQLRKRGNYLHNVEVLQNGSGELITPRRTVEDYSVSEYLPCPHCLALYMRRSLGTHEKKCKMRKYDVHGHKKVKSALATLLPMQGYVSGACEGIFRSMSQSSVLDHIKKDALICKYGDTLLVKYNHDKRQHAYVGKKMKELGRFMLAVKELDASVEYLKDICTPSRFDLVINGTKKVCGFEESSNAFEIPSLVLRIAYSLRQAAEILCGERFVEGDPDRVAQVEEFVELIEANLIHSVKSSSANNNESTNPESCTANTVATPSVNQHRQDLTPEVSIPQCSLQPDLWRDLEDTLEFSPESSLKSTQNLMTESLLGPPPDISGPNLKTNPCNVSDVNTEFQTVEGGLFSCRTKEPSTSSGAVLSGSKLRTPKITIYSKFSFLSCLRAKHQFRGGSKNKQSLSSKRRVVKTSKTGATCVVQTKQFFCIYCKQLVLKIARHLVRNHADEEDVARALSLPKGSKSRSILFTKLRNRGAYQHNVDVLEKGTGKLITVKNQKKHHSSEYKSCPDCLGFYLGQRLEWHRQRCEMKDDGFFPKKRLRLRQRKTFALPECLSEGCGDVVRRMRHDDISKHLRNDPLICKFGNRLYEKHGEDKALTYNVSQKMRELARFMLAVKELDQNVEFLQDVCKDSTFDLALEAAKKVCCFDYHSDKFKTPSRPLRLYYSLRQSAEIALEQSDMGEEALAGARKFIKRLETDWVSYVHSHTYATSSPSKWSKMNFVSLTEDLIKLHTFLERIESQAKRELEENTSATPWSQLRNVLLVEMALFNRGRRNVADKMLLEDGLGRSKGPLERSKRQFITELEKRLSSTLFKVEVTLGEANAVPVLFTDRMASSLDALTKYREEVGVPSENPYVFSRMVSPSFVRASDCLRTFARICGASEPEHLSSVSTHKEVAVVFQILSLNQSEIRCVEAILGDCSYDWQTLKENSLELAKLCKLLYEKEYKTLPLGTNFGNVSAAAFNAGKRTDVSEATRNEGLAASKEKRTKWKPEEQQAVRRQMERFITLMKVPGKMDCLVCLNAEPDALKSRTWQDVKNHVHNTIQANKRRSKTQMEDGHDESDEDFEGGVDSDADADGPFRRLRQRGRTRSGTDIAGSSGLGSPSHSKLHHLYGVQAWGTWVQWRHKQSDVNPLTVSEDVLQCSPEILSEGLRHFITEVRRPNGQTYAPDSVYYLCLGIQQYLLENGRLENIFMDPLYSQFTRGITRLIKDWVHTLPPSGLSQSRVEESFLWECKQLGTLSPVVLLNTLLFFVVKFLGLKTLEQHRQLSFANVIRCARPSKQGTAYSLRFSLPAKDEDRRVVAGKRKREEEDEEYRVIPENTDNPLHCPVKLYEFYLSRCGDLARSRPDLFYLQPDASCSPASSAWYSPQPLEPELMESMLTRVLTVRAVHLRSKSQHREDPASSSSSSNDNDDNEDESS